MTQTYKSTVLPIPLPYTPLQYVVVSPNTNTVRYTPRIYTYCTVLYKDLYGGTAAARRRFLHLRKAISARGVASLTMQASASKDSGSLSCLKTGRLSSKNFFRVWTHHDFELLLNNDTHEVTLGAPKVRAPVFFCLQLSDPSCMMILFGFALAL